MTRLVHSRRIRLVVALAVALLCAGAAWGYWVAGSAGSANGHVGALAAPSQAGVAFFAHVGGFLAGVGFVFLTGARHRRPAPYLGPRLSTRALKRR